MRALRDRSWLSLSSRNWLEIRFSGLAAECHRSGVPLAVPWVRPPPSSVSEVPRGLTNSFTLASARGKKGRRRSGVGSTYRCDPVRIMFDLARAGRADPATNGGRAEPSGMNRAPRSNARFQRQPSSMTFPRIDDPGMGPKTDCPAASCLVAEDVELPCWASPERRSGWARSQRVPYRSMA